MTYSPREMVMNALQTILVNALTTGGTPLLVSVSRKLKLWGDTQQGDRPCMFMHQLPDDVVGGKTGVPSVTTMHVNLFIYTWAKGMTDTPPPASLLNPIIDGVFLALKPTNLQTGKNNLGIVFVDNCWVEGKIFIDPGDLDGDGLAIVPLKILFATPLAYS